MKISEHPFYERIKSVSAKTAASWIIGEKSIWDVDPALRKKAFREIGRKIIAGRTERSKYGFNSDSAGEIASALEWAYKQGIKSTKTG